MKKLIVTGILGLSLSADVFAGNIYRCVDAAGNISFSQTACQSGDEGGKIAHTTPSLHQPLVVNSSYRDAEHDFLHDHNPSASESP